ncbi:hypothetical protein MKK37_11255 [Staphylococcus epidermidis]|uniref:hypothetical protein n=1 Tax=Staphylococcus epidermidis TaxID=1282 RepID=UPI001F06051B|nr:hypothetical protein [Staphylococcus epidermidis]MCH1587519.1 hypothetical protein [Staphylococcus epidermidis]
MTGLLTETQLKFLRLLTRTGFATNKHLAQMQINRLQNSNNHITDRLLKGNYIGRVMVNASFGTGRKVMFYITKKGAKFIADNDGVALESLAYTTYSGGIKKAHIDGEVSLVRTDFAHKERYISTFLALENYLENTDYLIGDFYHYYQLKGDKGTSLAVNGKNFRPDGVIFCKPITPQKPTFAYVIEIHRHSDRRRIIMQLLQHIEAIKQQSLKARFGFDKPYFVLSVFTDENLAVMKSVISELQTFDEWQYIQKFFMFAKLDDLLQNFYAGAVYFGGSKKPLPPQK